MKQKGVFIILLIICASCPLFDGDHVEGYSVGDQFTLKFSDSTLRYALDYMQKDKDKLKSLSFQIRNDHKFKSLVFKDVLYIRDLLNQIESQTNCEIVQSGRDILIILPKENDIEATQ